MALVEEMPSLAEVRCYDLYPEAARRFVADMGATFPALRFIVCMSAAEAARPADVVVTAVPIVVDPAPTLDGGQLKEGALAYLRSSRAISASWPPVWQPGARATPSASSA